MKSDQYQSASGYMYIELSSYLNVRYMVFIVSIIRPGKITKSILLMDIIQQYYFSHKRSIAIDG